MFSAITIASSTKIPITIIIPKVDNTLIVSPKIGANINIPKKETGRPKATQKAILEFKKIENIGKGKYKYSKNKEHKFPEVYAKFAITFLHKYKRTKEKKRQCCC